ncbi:MAG: hypothetical protein JNL48_00980 [Acidobacteria bacterium]|nr:hypothetical protein [Acidobacteriota bacterium]
MSVSARLRLAALVSVAVMAAACAEPPTKELSLAEGGIDAARAAGAAEFAREDLADAEATLARAHADVTAGDYRAALGHALDANTKAQTAAKAAADGRVKARLAADETLDRFAVHIERVEAALAADEAKRVPAATRRRVEAQVKAALETLAAARAAVDRGELATLTTIGGQTATLDEALTSLAPPPAKKARSRR